MPTPSGHTFEIAVRDFAREYFVLAAENRAVARESRQLHRLVLVLYLIAVFFV